MYWLLGWLNVCFVDCPIVCLFFAWLLLVVIGCYWFLLVVWLLVWLFSWLCVCCFVRLCGCLIACFIDWLICCLLLSGWSFDIYWWFACVVCRLSCSMFDWLFARLILGLFGWFVHCLIDCVVGSLIVRCGWMFSYVFGCSVCRLVGCLIWAFVWLLVWFVDWLVCFSFDLLGVCLSGCLVDSLVHLLHAWYVVWVSDCLFARLIHWLNKCLIMFGCSIDWSFYWWFDLLFACLFVSLIVCLFDWWRERLIAWF